MRQDSFEREQTYLGWRSGHGEASTIPVKNYANEESKSSEDVYFDRNHRDRGQWCTVNDDDGNETEELGVGSANGSSSG